MVFEEIKQEIAKLIDFPDVILTKRGNESIKLALEIAKNQNKPKIFILDQGGWITYPQFIQKLDLEEIEIKTNDCEIDLDDLEKQLNENSTLLIHSLSGYWYKQPMEEIYDICKNKNALLICDVAGGIIDKNLVKGDIIIGSFGRWKPIDNHSGGFIATNLENNIEPTTEIKTPKQLLEKIKKVKERSEFLNNKSLEIIKEIKNNNLTTLNDLENNPDMNYVVLSPFNTKEEKEILLNIANRHNLEANECPREIRSLRQAISFEIKKL